MTSMRVSIATCGSSDGSDSISMKSTGSWARLLETALELCFDAVWEAVFGGEE